MKLSKPLCPRCGCPPRYLIGQFHVHVGVSLKKEGNFELTGEKRVGRPAPNEKHTAECGGGHQWKTVVRSSDEV